MQFRLINVIAHAIDDLLRITAEPDFISSQRKAMAGQLTHGRNLMLWRLQLKVSRARILVRVVGAEIHFGHNFCVATHSNRAESCLTHQQIGDHSENWNRKHNHHPRHGHVRAIALA